MITDDRSETISSLVKTLEEKGVVTTRSGSGKMLFLMTTAHLGLPAGGFMVAMSGGGCFLWDGDRDVNPFRLISSGFDLDAAATLADVLNAIYASKTQRPAVKALESP